MWCRVLQGFMNWNAVRHVPGSSTDPDADTIKVIMDRRGGFSSMVMVIHAGNDQMFWQVCVPGHARQLWAVCAVTQRCLPRGAPAAGQKRFFRFCGAGCGSSRHCLHTHTTRKQTQARPAF